MSDWIHAITPPCNDDLCLVLTKVPYAPGVERVSYVPHIAKYVKSLHEYSDHAEEEFEGEDRSGWLAWAPHEGSYELFRVAYWMPLPPLPNCGADMR